MPEDPPDDIQKDFTNDSLEPSHEPTEKGPDFPSNQQKVMEVFHPPDLHHRKKPWKQYFLEFLMIFLAVTLGFFAETLREYISDNRHVRQLGGQLIHDLKNDSAILNENIVRDAILVKK